MKVLTNTILWSLFFLAIWPLVIFETNLGIYAGTRTIWGDWAVHLTYANVFANLPVTEWFTQNPILSSATFNYPFVSAAISGMFMRQKFSLIQSMLFPSIVTSFIFVFALSKFYTSHFKSLTKTMIANALVFFSGGLGIFYVAEEFASSGSSFRQILSRGHEFTMNQSKNLQFGNFTFTEFLPQRAMLLGIPIGLFIIIYLEKYLRQRHISAIWKDVFFGALYGTLPFVHLHSFVAVSLVIGTYGVLCIRSWRTTLNFVFASSLPIIAWWYFFYRTSTNNSPIEFIKGWYIQDSWLEIAKFWFMNLGIFLPLALFGTILNGNFRNPSIISGWLLFLFGNFVKLQPWIWDNMKLFTWSFILIVPTVVDSMEYIANLFDKRISRIGSTFVLMLLLTISGFAEVSRIFWEKNTNLQMFSSEDLALAEEFRSFSKPTDLVLTSDKHNHWVSAVAGRRLVMGFKGWLWSYGLDYSNTERDVKAIFEGRDAGHELVKRYGIKFIVVGPSEHQNFKINNDYFKNNYPVALSKVDTTIYRIE